MSEMFDMGEIYRKTRGCASLWSRFQVTPWGIVGYIAPTLAASHPLQRRCEPESGKVECKIEQNAQDDIKKEERQQERAEAPKVQQVKAEVTERPVNSE